MAQSDAPRTCQGDNGLRERDARRSRFERTPDPAGPDGPIALALALGLGALVETVLYAADRAIA